MVNIKLIPSPSKLWAEYQASQGDVSHFIIHDGSKLEHSPHQKFISDERKFSIAIEWAIDLDAHYSKAISATGKIRIDIPKNLKFLPIRVPRESIEEYRRLRLTVGQLLYPVLAEIPFTGELYEFQKDGVKWLLRQPRGILADDMGLGKTVQVISAMRKLFSEGLIRNALVICPKNLLANWSREFSAWAPELGIAIASPPNHIRSEAWKAIWGRRHVILTNYEQLRNPPGILRSANIDLLVADEAHRLRRRAAKVTSGIFHISCNRCWALTGTPIEKDNDDLATLLSLVVPNSFSARDAKLPPPSLRGRARSYILRRRKEDVLQDLPFVLDSTALLDMTERQRSAYKTIISEIQRQNSHERKLGLLTRLLSICDMEPISRESCKIDRIVDQFEQVRANGEKGVVFSYRLAPLHELHHRLTQKWGNLSASILVGEMPGKDRDQAIDQFKNSNQTFCLLASSRIGGEGLTLTEANHVFLLNQWWNPSANEQARDRLVRIGQKRKVQVYRYCCHATVEEKLGEILDMKKDLVDSMIERLAVDDLVAWDGLLRETQIDPLLRHR